MSSSLTSRASGPIGPRTAQPVLLLNRELAILEFNRRVLAQAALANIPVLERLRYLTIVSANLDEFFEVRMAPHMAALRDALPGSGEAARLKLELQRIGGAVRELLQAQCRVYTEELRAALGDQKIAILGHVDRDAAQQDWVRQYFVKEAKPLLSATLIDPRHPFPKVANKSLNFILRLQPKKKGDVPVESVLAVIKIPRALPRVIRLPAKVSQGRQVFVLLSSVLRSNLSILLPEHHVLDCAQFRLTRDSDLWVRDDDQTDLRQALNSQLHTRQFGMPVRLEVNAQCSRALARLLLQQFELPACALYRMDAPLNLVRLQQVLDLAEPGKHRFKPYEPGWTPALQRKESMWSQLARRDVLLHHPYESFEPVLQLLREAADDKHVLQIQQTIYRAGLHSEVMDLLCKAARRGKEVTVVFELMARFDEAVNIAWAEQLEKLGGQVLYGLPGMKTHCKMLLITRREKKQWRHYAHISTGNYNVSTTRSYTDLGLLTSHPEFCADIQAMFVALRQHQDAPALKHLVNAPQHLRQTLLSHLVEVSAQARRGREARVLLKLNALTDEGLIAALVDAAQAGAQVDLIVRGACLLPPGLPELTERVRVRSIIGRFLEHSRVYHMVAGEQVWTYLSSADGMARNLDRRVELAWPLLDPVLRQRVYDEVLTPYLLDGEDAWAQGPDGRYQAVKGVYPSAQQALMRKHAGARKKDV
jgi:polyphosphate kinase